MSGMTEDNLQHESRKRDHLRLALNAAHQAYGLSGLASICLRHEALPDLNFNDVRLDSVRLGQTARTPFYVAAITAGHPEADSVNAAFAAACRGRGWALGIGSQRREFESGQVSPFWRELHEKEPGLELFANIGASQIISGSVRKLRRVVDESGAVALVVHANALQECLQPEGTPAFRGIYEALRRLCGELGKPVVLKETGCGFSQKTLEKLVDTGLAAIDVSGLGGTHWGRIEGARRSQDDHHAGLAAAFDDWGVSTVDSVINAVKVIPGVEIWASGGVRSGVDAAKLIALGATQVGYAQPALEALAKGSVELERWMERQELELKIAMFCTGSSNAAQLKADNKVWRKIND